MDFLESHCEVISKTTKKIALIGYRHGNFYEANLSLNFGGSITCLIRKASVEESWNWHKRLSHLNFSNLNELLKKNLVRGLPKAQFAQEAKQRRISFKGENEFSIS